MLSEAYQRVAALQLGSNCCSFIAILPALSSAALKSETSLYRTCGRRGFESVVQRGLAENVRIPLYGGKGLTLLKKPSYDIKRFLNSILTKINFICTIV